MADFYVNIIKAGKEGMSLSVDYFLELVRWLAKGVVGGGKMLDLLLVELLADKKSGRQDAREPKRLSRNSRRYSVAYIVPKGHYVLACPAVSQVDKSLWFKPEEWIPSRWTNSEGQAQQAFEQYAVENGEKVDYGFGALGTLISTVDRNVEMRILTGVPPPNYHTMISTLPKQPGSDHRKHEGIALGHQNRVEMVYVNSQTNSNQPPPPKV
ncbi:hypothetical protein EDB84DRAFT_1556498 [Lactarius hengduanensis]|nr:hypothetical protein EDB84DRAFT_1556498 [Lactarius hengduanensis]